MKVQSLAISEVNFSPTSRDTDLPLNICLVRPEDLHTLHASPPQFDQLATTVLALRILREQSSLEQVQGTQAINPQPHSMYTAVAEANWNTSQLYAPVRKSFRINHVAVVLSVRYDLFIFV